MIYGILYNTLIGAKPLRIIFDKVNEFVRDYGVTKYLPYFHFKNYGAIYDRIKCLKGLKSGITYFS